MNTRQKLEKKILEKEKEIHELMVKLHQAEAYIAAMYDAIRLIPKDEASVNGDVNGGVVIKPGSAIEAAHKALKEVRKPLHVMELLKVMGRDATSENRASLVSSLAAYVRKRQVFTRTSPNTFGLTEWGEITGPEDTGTSTPDSDGPPEDFGLERPPVDSA